MAGSRRILARLASGGVVVAGAVVGFKLVGLVGTGAAAGIPGLTQTMVYAAPLQHALLLLDLGPGPWMGVYMV